MIYWGDANRVDVTLKWTFGIKSRYLWQQCNVVSLIISLIFTQSNGLYFLLYCTLDDTPTPKDLVSLKCDSMEGFKDLLFTQSLAEPMDVRCLDSLVRAHVLLAVMSKRTSPEHQLNLLRASTFVLQIWQARPPSYHKKQHCLCLRYFEWMWEKYSLAQCLSRQVSMATHSHAPIKKGQESSQKSTRGKKVNNVRLPPGIILYNWLPCVIWMEEKLKHLFTVGSF